MTGTILPKIYKRIDNVPRKPVILDCCTYRKKSTNFSDTSCNIKRTEILHKNLINLLKIISKESTLVAADVVWFYPSISR